jgi:hypothetical protein
MLGVQDLRAFSLAQWIKTQCCHTKADHLQSKSLVIVGSFGSATVATGHDHGGYRTTGRWQVQIGCDPMTGLAVKNHTLDAEAFRLNRANRACIQRSSCGHWSQLFSKVSPTCLNPLLHVRSRTQLSVLSITLITGQSGLLLQSWIQQNSRRFVRSQTVQFVSHSKRSRWRRDQYRNDYDTDCSSSAYA